MTYGSLSKTAVYSLWAAIAYKSQDCPYPINLKLLLSIKLGKSGNEKVIDEVLITLCKPQSEAVKASWQTRKQNESKQKLEQTYPHANAILVVNAFLPQELSQQQYKHRGPPSKLLELFIII